MAAFERLEGFLDRLTGDVYPEPSSKLHLTIIQQTVANLLRGNHLRAGDRVLDVGCGQGDAMELFRQNGMEATGIALGTDIEACRARGLDAVEMDMARLDFPDAAFDVVWCRHALEHSIFPLFTLAEFRRLLRPGGRLYVEVPAPDTVAHHERNPNHYSVLGKSMWLSLFGKAGFDVALLWDLNFTLEIGPDTYWAFLLQPAG